MPALAFVDDLGQGPAAEQQLHWEVDPQTRFHAGHELDRGQRGTTKGEEIPFVAGVLSAERHGPRFLDGAADVTGL